MLRITSCGLSRVAITKGLKTTSHPLLERGSTEKASGTEKYIPSITDLIFQTSSVLKKVLYPIALNNNSTHLFVRVTIFLSSSLTAQANLSVSFTGGMLMPDPIKLTSRVLPNFAMVHLAYKGQNKNQ